MKTNKENIYINTDERLFLIQDDIDNATISKVLYNIIYLIKIDNDKDSSEKNYTRKPIHIYVNSRGGYVDDMWSLIDVILSSKTPIHTYCTGYAMSAGFQIYLAGHKRFISKHAKLLYHQVSGYNWGKYLDMKQDFKDVERDQTEIIKYILSRTKITKERIDEVVEKKIDWYIYSDEAIKLGIADEII